VLATLRCVLGRWTIAVTRMALLALLLALLPVTASAINCQSEKGSGSPWSWIDGKRCWYMGTAGLSKDKLRWSRATRAAPREDDAERQRLLNSYWPPLPPTATFQERFDEPVTPSMSNSQ
jgi:hypothetical protein